MDGVRLDPVQLGEDIDRRFGGELVTTVQSVVPSEIYMHEGVLQVNGATIDDVAVALRDYRYRQNIGPYVPLSAIEAGAARHARVLGGVLHDVPRIARRRGPVRVRRDRVRRRRPGRRPGDP